ncbi:MAG: RNA polymerase sigma factor, partial [Planctomycetota bacterium]
PLRPKGQSTPGGDAEGDPARGSALEAERRRVQRARRGDRDAFAELVRVHRSRVQRVALRIVGSPEDAEDVAQETFVRAWRGLGRLDSAGRFGPWLLGICVHLCRDHQRSSGRRAEDAAAQLLDLAAERADDADPSARATEAELRARVELAIAALPTKLRVPFVLRALEGETYEEVARITGARPATVRTWMVQARRALRRSLGTWIEEEIERG